MRTKHRDIIPRAGSPSKLRSGKVRKQHKWSSRHICEAQVLTCKHVNDGIKKLAEDMAQKLERQRVQEEKKKAAEKKTMRESLEKQWSIDLHQYNEVVIPAWRAECAEIYAAWAANEAIRSTRKKAPIPLTKATFKSQDPANQSVIVGLADVPEAVEEDVGEGGNAGGNVGNNAGSNAGSNAGGVEEDLVDSIRALEIDHLVSDNPILLFCKTLLQY